MLYAQYDMKYDIKYNYFKFMELVAAEKRANDARLHAHDVLK